LLRFLVPYRRAVVASFALAALAMCATVLIPYLLGRGVDDIRRGDRHALAGIAIAIAVAAMLRLALTVGRRLIAGRVSLGVEYDLRNGLYGHLQSLELGFFDRQQTGQLMSRATVDLQSVRFFLGYGLIFLTQSALQLALGGVAMFAIDPALAAIALAPVPFVVWVAQRYGRRARPALQEVQQRIAELTADVEENVSGVRVVKAFAAEPRQLERFRSSVTRVFDQAMYSTRLQAFYQPLIGFLPNLGLGAILFFGGRAVLHHNISIGQFTAFYFYLQLLISPMRTLGVALGMAQRATASGRRLFEILDRAPEMAAPEHPRPLPAGDGHVQFRAVTFTFPGARTPTLHEIDLTVEAGSTIALVGATGAGKTSLVSLVPRLYDPEAGAVLLDGVDVRELDPTELRRAIAIVADDPFLFSSTVAENIAYARPSATHDAVELAARRAQAHDFIVKLPDGYETEVGERGLTLSGGQRQRLALARAMVADPRVLILDDATSSVDASTEQEIKRGLQDLMAGRTTFVIAHRLSTIALADDIVVLEHGRIAERGPHDELIESSPLYREIVEKGLPDQVFLNRKPLEQEVAGL